jgi:hypothetical protein
VQLGPQALQAGDGARLENEPHVRLRATSAAEALVFDLP